MPTAVSTITTGSQLPDKKVKEEKKHNLENEAKISCFPLYIGTDEEEIAPLKRTSTDQTLSVLDKFDDIAKLLLESYGLKFECSKQLPSPVIATVIPRQDQTNAAEEKKPAQSRQPISAAQSSPQPLSRAQTPTPAANAKQSNTNSANNNVGPTPSKPKTSITPALKKPTPLPSASTPTPTPTPMSWASIASSASTPATPSKSATSSTVSSNSTITSTSSISQQAAVSKPNQKQSSPSSLTENESQKVSIQSDLTPEVSLSPGAKPLGIILLRLIFDPAYLANAIKNKKSDLVIPHGLSNSGNICYMNSILQFLFACQPFSQMLNIIREHSIAKLDNKSTPILNSLLLLHESFKKKSSAEDKVDILDPNAFYKSIAILPRFSHLQWGRQEDAEEFLGHLLDELHEEFVKQIAVLSTDEVKEFANAFHNKEIGKRVVRAVEFIKGDNKESQFEENGDGWKEIGANKKPAEKRTFEVKYSPIVTLFGGQFKSVLKLPNNKSSITLDPFMQVQLDIGNAHVTDLLTAFHKFSEDEEISMGKGTAKKQNFIDKVPSVLIIQLKRFSFVTYESGENENNSFSEVVSKGKKKKDAKSQNNAPSTPKTKVFDCRIEKISKFISYEHELVLPTECISTNIQELPKFELIGVVYHHGRDTENGHYTAEMKSANDQWIKIDDTSITNLTAEDVISDKTQQNKTAYILMYKKIFT